MKLLQITLLFFAINIANAQSKMALIININDNQISGNEERKIITQVLAKNNYQVWEISNLPLKSLTIIIDKFINQANTSNSEIVIYYFGHAFSNNGNTFLSTYDKNYISLNYIYQRVSLTKQPKVIFINACRTIIPNIKIASHNKIKEQLPNNTFTLFSATIGNKVPNTTEFAELICKAINLEMELTEIAMYVQNNNTCLCLSPVYTSTMNHKYYINNHLNY